MSVRLDQRKDWAELAENAKRHFAKRDAINAAPRERMAAHPCSEDVRNNGRHFSDLSRRDYAILYNSRRA